MLVVCGRHSDVFSIALQGNHSNGNLNGTQVYGGVCPSGHYCPSGTIRATQYHCPNGTYNPTYGGQVPTACIACDPGKVCNGVGLSAPNGLCAPGFYCIRGAKSKMPVDGTTGDICPIGSYCPGNTSVPYNCLAGTYRYFDLKMRYYFVTLSLFLALFICCLGDRINDIAY